MIIIGRTEHITLVDLEIDSIASRIDSGAFSSSLHATNIEFYEIDNQKMVRFQTVNNKNYTAKLLYIKKVKSSNGSISERAYIKTKIRIAGLDLIIKMNLMNREKMRYKILLGRNTLSHHFLIDCSKRFITG